MRFGLGTGLRVFVVAVVVASVMFVSPGAEAASSTAVFGAVLRGAAEVPGPGDPDGRGAAVVVVRPSRGQVCFALLARRIADATLAHIHRGTADVAGPVVIDLIPPDPTSSGCVRNLDPELLQEIVDDPSGFYVNVHNDEFPRGAIRGQLKG
jgi:hypothetical protein